MTRNSLRDAGRMIICCCLTAAMGCGGGSDAPPTAPVSGIVKYNGSPLAGAQVTFRGGGHTGIGVTGPDGTYTLSTFGDGDGATLGEKQVTVTKRITVGGGSATGGSQTMEEAAAAAERGETAGPPKVESAVPEKYSDPTTSGLSYTVVDGDNKYDIELTD